jgi:hypothetical protein
MYLRSRAGIIVSLVLGKHGGHGPVQHNSSCKGALHRAAVASHDQPTICSSEAPKCGRMCGQLFRKHGAISDALLGV